MHVQPLGKERREDRFEIVLSGHCSNGRGRRSIAEISDLSIHGCKVETTIALLEINAAVWIKLGSRDQLQGRVRWRQGNLGGVEWDYPLHPAILDHIYAMHDASRGLPSLGPASAKFELREPLRRII